MPFKINYAMKVSVSLVTYNQEKYIVQAIESILMQKTDFNFEIIIGEDESQDNTRSIVMEYRRRYPDKIRLFLNARNDKNFSDGMPAGRQNLINNLNNANGEYIALLDGDDYWTSPDKLQRQVNFLDSHPKCSMCFHSIQMVTEEGQLISIKSPKGKKQIYTLRDLLRDNFIFKCSVMFRKGLFKDFPEWFYKTYVADWPLYILNAKYGDIGYMNQVMGAYRIHSGGMHSSKGEMEQVRGIVEIYPYINEYLGYRYDTYIKTRMRFKLIEKKMGLFLASHGLGKLVGLYRKIFY